MTEKLTVKEEKGKSNITSDKDQTIAVSELTKTHSSSIISPFKELLADEANAQEDSGLQEVDKIAHEKIGAPSEKVMESVEDDRSVGNLPVGPGSRVLSLELLGETYCLSKTLSSSQVIQENPRLYLEPIEASLLTNRSDVFDNPQSSFSEKLLIFDRDDRRYDMVLSQYGKGETTQYSISGGWSTFLRVHNLKAGDVMIFYRILDKNVSDAPYYILKYFRKPSGRIVYKSNRNKRKVARQHVYKGSDKVGDKNVPQPGSRALTGENKCLSKRLRPNDVIPGNCKLNLSAHEASSLTDCSGTLGLPSGALSKFLLVYDGDNRPYYMVLKYNSNEKRTEYFLNAEWKRFVLLHKLKAGDVLTFYRIADKNVCEGFYYILKYFRKPADRTNHVLDSKKQSDDRQIHIQEKTELKIDTIREVNASVSSDKLEKSEVERYVPVPVPLSWPSSGDLSNMDYRLSKTLQSFEVDPDNPMLFLYPYEAYILTDFPELLECPSGFPSMYLSVLDKEDAQYDMMLSLHTRGNCVGYSLSEGWELYFLVHDLKVDDKITFYKISDRTMSDDGQYYILECSRKSEEPNDSAAPSDAGRNGRKDLAVVADNKELQQTSIETKDDNVPEEMKPHRIVPGPGSWAMTPQDQIFRKTLGSQDVNPEDPKLYIYNYQASLLTDNPRIGLKLPGSFSKNLLVFDTDNRRYYMVLTHIINSTLIGFCITGDWNRFISIHNLEAGDDIAFYRIIDKGVADDYYYVINFLKKPGGTRKNESELKGVNL